MRIFNDLELVEQLGTGIPRILKHYGRECFQITENYIRIVLPTVMGLTEQVAEQVAEQVKKIVKVLDCHTLTTSEIMLSLELKHRPTFLYDYLHPALEQGFIEMTIPDKPNSSKQKYRLTEKGKVIKKT
jgi:predicted HTH transcriptional regulator